MSTVRPAGGRGVICRHHWVEVIVESGGGWVPVDPLLGEFGRLDASHVRLDAEELTIRSARIVDLELRQPAALRSLKRDRVIPPCDPNSHVTVGWTRGTAQAGRGGSLFSPNSAGGWTLESEAEIDGASPIGLDVVYDGNLAARTFAFRETAGDVTREIKGSVSLDHVSFVSTRGALEERYRFELEGPLLVSGDDFPRSWIAGLAAFELNPEETFPLDVLLVDRLRIERTQVQVFDEVGGRVVEIRLGGKTWYRLRLDFAERLEKFENLTGGLIGVLSAQEDGGGSFFEE